MSINADALARAMQSWGFLETPAPDAAMRWIETFLQAFGDLQRVEDARDNIGELRAESCVIPALELERLRTRAVLFYLDSVGQYIDAQPDLHGLPLSSDLPAIASEFGIAADDAFETVRMALTGRHDGPALELLFPLLGYDRMLIRIGAVNSRLLHGRGLETIPYGPDGRPFQTVVAVRPEPDDDVTSP